jgi:hypothetical protein
MALKRKRDFTITESESHFMQHTRLWGKPRKNWEGKKKPKLAEEELPAPKPPRLICPSNHKSIRTEMLGYKFICADCCGEYIKWKEHEPVCPGQYKKPAALPCNICGDVRDLFSGFPHHTDDVSCIPMQTYHCKFCQPAEKFGGTPVTTKGHYCKGLERWEMGALGREMNEKQFHKHEQSNRNKDAEGIRFLLKLRREGKLDDFIDKQTKKQRVKQINFSLL